MQRLRRTVSVLIAVFTLFTTTPPGLFVRVASATTASFPITQSFTGSSASDWVLGGSATLTGDGSTDPSGSGWLRLTSNATYQAGYAYYDQPFSASLGVMIEFDYAAYDGTGADGASFFLFDGATTSFNVGAAGGGLGYAQKSSSVNGVSNGYVGIGLDEYGNFANPGDGRTDGPGSRPNYVGVRGAGNGTTGYAWVDGAASTLFTGNRSAGIHVRMYLTPDKKITVQIKTASQGYTTVINQAQLSGTPPATYKLGFAASTGGSTNYHEVRNLTVALPASLPVAITGTTNGHALVADETVSPGQAITYTATITNDGENPVTGATTTFTAGGLTGIAWTCSGSSGGVCGAASGTSLTPTADLPVGATVTYTVTAQVANPATGPVSFSASAQAAGYTNVSSASSATLRANLAPVAQNQSVTFLQNTAKTFTLQASDLDGDTLTATLVSGQGPAHGSVSFSGLSATFTPTANYVGTDSFRYTVSDGKGATSNAATVSLTTPTPDLSNLVPSGGTLWPAFSSGTTTYSVSVPFTTSSLTVTPTTVDPQATIQVAGNAVTSGAASSAIALAVGSTTISTVVTASDSSAAKTYAVTVHRASPSSNARLSQLALSQGTLNPVFSSGATSYTATVPGGVSAVAVTPTVEDTTATAKVNGVAVNSGSASGPIPLAVGSNSISVATTAQDGISTRAYSVVVTRLAPAASITSPAGGSHWAMGRPAISGTADALTAVNIKIDGNSAGTATPDSSGNWSFAPATALADGTHTVQATAVASDGAAGTPSQVQFVVDTTPPTIVAAPDRQPSASGWYNGPVTVSFTCADAIAGVATCPQPATLAADGADQSVSGTATDQAGNMATVAVRGINIDTTPPSGSIRIGDGSGVADQRIVILNLSATDSTSGVAAMRLSSDGTNWSAWEASAPERFYTLDHDGANTLRVQYQDKAGNLSAAASAQVTLDRAKPQGSARILRVSGDPSRPILHLAVSARLSLSGLPGSQPPQVRFAVGGGAWSDWQDVTAQMQVPLTAGDGLKTVAVQFGRRDHAVSDVQRLQLVLTYRGGIVDACYDFQFPPGSGPVGTYFYDPGLQRLVRLATVYDQRTGRGTAIARNPSMGFWLTIPEPPASFTDIGGSPVKDELLALAQMNIIHGYSDGTFRPHRSITRAEAATLIIPAIQVGDAGQTGFPDTEGHWADLIVKRAASAGVVNGYADGMFRPDHPVTRAEFVKMLALPFALPQRPAGSANLFTDLNGHWAQVVVENAAANIIPTDSDTFRPDDPITREEAVHMLFRAVNYLYSQLERDCGNH